MVLIIRLRTARAIFSAIGPPSRDIPGGRS
jgi:hypothetical protein